MGPFDNSVDCGNGRAMGIPDLEASGDEEGGECLDSRRWCPKFVGEREKNRLVFAGQYKQSPIPTVGNLIRTDDVRYFGRRDPATGARDADPPSSFDLKIISADDSFKDLKTSDKVGLLAVGTKGPRRTLLHITNGRLDLDGSENEILRLQGLYKPITATLIEDTANGPAMVGHLTQRIPGAIPRSAAGGRCRG